MSNNKQEKGCYIADGKLVDFQHEIENVRFPTMYIE